MRTATSSDFNPPAPLMLDARARRLRRGLSRAAGRAGPVFGDVGAHAGTPSPSPLRRGASGFGAVVSVRWPCRSHGRPGDATR